MEEIELGVEEVVAPNNPYDKIQVTPSKAQKDSLYVDEAAKAISQGESIEVAVQNLATKDVSQIHEEGAVRHVERTKSIQAGVVEKVAIEKPEALPETITSAQKFINEAGASILASKYDWIDSVSTSEHLTREDRMSVAVNMGLMQRFTEEVDKETLWGLVPNFFGAIFIPDSPYNIAAQHEGLLGDKVTVDSILSSPALVDNLIGFRQSLSLEEQAVYDKVIVVPFIEGVTDNKLKRVELASMLTGFTSADSAKFFAGLDIVDSALIVSQLGTTVFKVVKNINSLRKLSKLNMNLAAREVSEAVAKRVEDGDTNLVEIDSDTIAQSAGIHQTDAAATGNPLVPEDLFAGAPEGTQGRFRNYLVKVDEHLTRAKNNLNVVIDPSKREELEIAASVEKRLKRDFDLENFKYARTDTGLNFKFDKYDGDDLVESNMSVDFELKDLGGLQQAEGSLLPPLARHVLSPLFQAGEDAGTFVKSAAGVMFASSRAQAQYGMAMAAALKPLKGVFKSNKGYVKSADKIDGIMQTLENTDTIPTYHKLVNEGVNGVKLTEPEFQAYSGIRKIMDDLWWENNDALRREWDIKGVKSISGDGRNWFAKTMDTSTHAISGYTGGSVGVLREGIVSHTKGSLSADEITQLYSEGKVLIKSWSTNQTEWFKTPAGLSEYAIVNRTEVGDLPRQVLGKILNYTPRINEDANFFLKKRVKTDINGVPTEIEKAIAFGKTESQLQKYIDNVLAKVADENPETVAFNADDYVIRFDREQVSDSGSVESVSLGGGLVRGHRSSEPLIDVNTQTGKQTNVIDAVQQYMSVTADKVNMSEWRAEARHRIIEEAASYPDIAQAARKGGWTGLKGTIEGSGIPSNKKQKLLTMFDQVDSMSRIPTVSEKSFQDFVIEVGKRFDKGVGGIESGKGQQGIAKFMYKWSDENPTNIAKSATFNLTLGMFNPAQIITQASGVTAAYTIHPIHALAATPRWLLAATLDFGTNERAAESFLGMFAKKAGVDAKTMKKDYEFWRKSGMYDTVIAGNADAAALKLGLPYDAGLLRRTISGVVEKGRIPFNIGEVANMRISFFTALERAKKLKGADFSYSDKDLIEVLGRAEDLRLNMSSANRSNIQKGFLGLPSQFLNIIKATGETAVSKNLSLAERGRFAAGQITLYGTAGIPLVGFLADHAMSAMGLTGTRVEGDGGYTSEELNGIKNGIVGKWLAGYGIESGIANKLTLASDIYNTIVDNFVGDEAKVQKAMFGASYRTGDRIHDVVMNTLAFGRVSVETLLDDDGDPLELKLVALELAKSLVDLPSSSRQYQAALDLNLGLVKRSDGTPLMFLNPSVGDVYATAVGFPLEEINGRYKVAREVRNIVQEERDAATRIISLLYTLENGLMGVDLSFSPEASQRAATILMDRVRNDLGGGSAKRVMEMVNNRLKSPKSWQEKNTEAIIRRAVDGTATAVMNLDVTSQRIIERGKK